MYKIAYLHKNEQEERDLYIPGDHDYGLTAGKLHVGMGISGELNISIPNDNPARHDIECLTDEIIVYRNEKEIWRGRPITLQVDFDLTGSLTCEGILSYLYDTYYPPFEFQGSPKELLQNVIDNHNSMVEPRKQFTLGEITVEDSNDYINRSSIYYNRTLQVLEEKFVGDSLGGYFRVRVEGDTRYLDYLTAYNTESEQPVEYGYNLLDIAQDIEYSDVATAILPLGAKLTDEDGFETDERLTVASVNNGDIYITDQSAVNTYGWIAVEAEWDDVTEPQNLYNKGYEYLTQVTSPVSKFTIEVVDLSLADPEIDPINLGDFVLIRVDAFGVNQYVELTSMDIDIVDPTDSSLKFGTEAATLTNSTNNTARTIQENMGDLSLRVTNLSTNVLNAVYANIENIVAGTITTDFIRAAVADLGYVTADWVEANYASIQYLEANYASILDLEVALENVELLNADVANILNVLAGNAGVGELETIHLTSANAVIDEAVIVNALMDTVLASVLTAGVIYTDYIKIADNEGQYLWIDGSTLQFKDENGVVRVQIGMDGEGNYNYYLWDENGVLIWNPLGLTEEGLTGNGAIIKDEAVADDANISGYKLNIQEVTQILNQNGDLIMNATQVVIDGETLDYKLTQITQEINQLETDGIVKIETYYSLGTDEAPYTSPTDETCSILGTMALGVAVLGKQMDSGWTLIQPTPNGDNEYVWFALRVTYQDGTTGWTDPTLLTDYYTRNAISIQQTELEVVQGQIAAKIWEDDILYYTDKLYNTLTTEITSQYGQLTVLIDSIDARVGSLTTIVNDNYEALESSITAITLDLDGILEEVRKVYEWTSDEFTEMSEQYAQIVIQVDGITQEVVNVWGELADNYSTTKEVSSLIDQAVSENEASILEKVSYSYVSDETFTDTLKEYYTSTETDALLNLWANDTSAGILESVSGTYATITSLEDGMTQAVASANAYTETAISASASSIMQQVSYTYATQDYVTEALKDIDFDGVTNIETYYAVSRSATSPDDTFKIDEDFSGGELPDGWTVFNKNDGTYEFGSVTAYGTTRYYLKGTRTSDTYYQQYRYYLPYTGRVVNFSVSAYIPSDVDLSQFDGSEQAFRVGVGSDNGSIYGYYTVNQMTQGTWYTLSREIRMNESSYTNGDEPFFFFSPRVQNLPICFTNAKFEYETEWTTDYPTVEDDEYIWVKYLITYDDGHTEWTEPFCSGTDLSNYPTNKTMTATIEQYVDESISKISLVVTASSSKTLISTGIPTSFDDWTVTSGQGASGSYAYRSDGGGCVSVIMTEAPRDDSSMGLSYRCYDYERMEAGTYHISCEISTTTDSDGAMVDLAAIFENYNSDYKSIGPLYSGTWTTCEFDVTVPYPINVSSYALAGVICNTLDVWILLRNLVVTFGTGTLSGDLGGYAGIYLTAGGETIAGGQLDLTQIREAFANDNSSVTIAAGTVSFLSNTLVITSKCLELDSSGNLTINTNQFTLTSSGDATFSGTLSAPAGNIGGWTIGTSSLYNNTSSMSSTTNGTYIGTNGIRQYSSGNYLNIQSTSIENGDSNNSYVKLTNGVMEVAYQGTLLGHFGTNCLENYPSQRGLVIDAEYNTSYIGFAHAQSSSATAYTLDYVLNYSASGLAYSEKHIFYGSARFTGSVSGISAASVTVEGNIYNTGEYYSASDTKVKVDVNDMLEKVDTDDIIDKLEPVTYRLKDYDDGKVHIGLTYQNLKEAIEAEGMDTNDMAILSSINDRNGEEIGMIAYSELIPILIGEIKQLKNDISTLKSATG